MQFFFATTYVSRHRAETRLVVLLPPNHSGLGGFRGLLLPTCARLTAHRTYSFGMAHFWDTYVPVTLGRTLCCAAIFDIRCQIAHNFKPYRPQRDQ